MKKLLTLLFLLTISISNPLLGTWGWRTLTSYIFPMEQVAEEKSKDYQVSQEPEVDSIFLEECLQEREKLEEVWIKKPHPKIKKEKEAKEFPTTNELMDRLSRKRYSNERPYLISRKKQDKNGAGASTSTSTTNSCPSSFDKYYSRIAFPLIGAALLYDSIKKPHHRCRNALYGFGLLLPLGSKIYKTGRNLYNCGRRKYDECYQTYKNFKDGVQSSRRFLGNIYNRFL